MAPPVLPVVALPAGGDAANTRDRRRSSSDRRGGGGGGAQVVGENPFDGGIEELRVKLLGHLRDAADRLRVPQPSHAPPPPTTTKPATATALEPSPARSPMPYPAATAAVLAAGGSASTSGCTPVSSLLGPNTSSPDAAPAQHSSLVRKYPKISDRFRNPPDSYSCPRKIIRFRFQIRNYPTDRIRIRNFGRLADNIQTVFTPLSIVN
ncbi:hypothetical protein E2562_029821 [Oryza meyeriana var. granulata]|uniref:Uncharacterized protein n=1 Tax=Oryza meyeriana var. granulata TaxID=110450 RepID=A0A6G1CTG6_9ORYZ|nr:hypothetical protein E2562_029821 [Oryza meyeriana var. granulata]